MNTKLSTTVSSSALSSLASLARQCVRACDFVSTLSHVGADKVDNRLHDLCAETHRQIQLGAITLVRFFVASLEFHPCLLALRCNFQRSEMSAGVVNGALLYE